MTNKNNNICPACQSEYETIYYQRRVADEPPDKVSYCPNCPIDIRKLSIEHKENISITSNSTYKHKIKHIPDNLLVYNNYVYYIEVEGNAAQRCYRNLLDKDISLNSIVGGNIPVQSNASKRVVTLHLNSITKNEAHISDTISRIAPFVSLNVSTILKPKVSIDRYITKCILGYEYILDPIDNIDTMIIRTIQEDKQPRILLFFDRGSKPSDSTILSVLQQILVKYSTETTIKRSIRSYSLLGVSN